MNDGGDFLKREALLSGVLFLSGGIAYVLIEILWRGYSHWSMFFAAGVCILLIRAAARLISGKGKLVLQCILGGLVITALELCAGCVLNLMLGMAVWDYSDMSFNLLGQICPLYTCFWMVLSLPALLLCNGAQRVSERLQGQAHR